MAKKCDTCGGAVDGLFKKVCAGCEAKADAKRFSDAIENRKATYAQALQAAKSISPSLAAAWERMHELIEAKWSADIGKHEKPYMPIRESFANLIPKGEKVVAVGQGVSGTSGASWAVTEESLVIELYSIWNGDQKSSEVAALAKITGVESKVFNKANNDRSITVTRAANSDQLSVIHAKVAEWLVEALSTDKSSGSAKQSVSDPAEAIRKLKGLLDDGLISQEEFDKKKADLLDKI
jgi:hypothetical protein